MKFTDGQWLLRKDVTVSSPCEIFAYEINEKSIVVHAPFRHIESRDLTIDVGLMTIRYTSPAEGVIGVKMSHYRGIRKKGPEFELNVQRDFAPEITDKDSAIVLKSGNLSVRLRKGEKWSADFFHGETRITGSGFKNAGYIQTGDGVYTREQLDLGVGGCVYGLGERFSAFVKNGQSIDIWNRDGGTDSEQAYKNIPFYLTNLGYGVFVNHPERVSFEVASESVSRVQFSVEGESLEYYLLDGPSPKEILERYTALTGRPAIPPAWTFGLWLSTSFTTDYDEKTVSGFIDEMARRDIPLSVFHFDCFWMKDFHFNDFEWNKDVFQEPAAMLERLKKKGLKICVWINPYIAQNSRLFDEGMENGYFLRKKNGDVWQWDRWQAGMAIVDFTNPSACNWFTGYLKKLLEMGVDSFKTDFGERIPEDVVYFDGSDPLKMHNYYAYLYNRNVFNLLEKHHGAGNAAVFARAAAAGSQKFPVHWGGDCWANYESMAESLRGGLSLGLSGFGFWSHDIGGFENTATPDLYKRWIAFGLLSSHSRLHGSKSYRVPWLFDEEAVDVLRFFTKLKCSLMPYLFSAACEASRKGIPVMRAMMIEFPEDPVCEYLDRQYMLGESLLVAPVFSADGNVNYYLPSGKWTNLLTGAVANGGCFRREKLDYMSVPLWVRPNTVLAVGNVDNKPDYDFAEQVVLHVFELEDNQTRSAVVHNPQGLPELEIFISRSGNFVSMDVHSSGKPWSLLWRGASKIQSVTGGKTSPDPQGSRIHPEPGVKRLILKL